MKPVYHLACAFFLAAASSVYAQVEDKMTADALDERPPVKPEEEPQTKDEDPASEKEPPVSDDMTSEKKNVVKTKPKPVSGPPEWRKLRETDQEYAACRLALSVLGTKYEEIPAIKDPDDRDCGIARPIRVQEIIPGVALQGGAEMRCDTARALGFWTQSFMRPAASALPEAPQLTGFQLGSGYSCRARVGTGKKRPKISQHALGNAIDIMAFEFSNGEVLKVEPRQDTGNIAEGFQRSAQSTACLYFSTVLGPGSNAAHNDHLHLDVAARKNGWRLCQ